MIASLPMYQRPELVDAHARYWELIRRGFDAAGIRSPETLSDNIDEFQTWLDPMLVLSQTCGMPYRNDLYGRVTLIGTPDFAVTGCRPGYYRSVFVVRRGAPGDRVEDFAGGVFAYNQHHSQSGFAAAYHHVAARGLWFERRHRSGSHLASIRAVADGRADIAAIDAVTWRLAERYETAVDTLRVIGWTDPTPGLPYIAGPNADAEATFDAVHQAIEILEEPHKSALGLRGLIKISAEEYLQVANPPGAITEAL